MVQTLTRGQAKVGKIIGQVAATAGEIGSTEIAAGAVSSSHLAAGAVSSSLVAAGAVSSSHIAAGAIAGSSQIAAGVVATADIASGAVTAPKMSFSPWQAATASTVMSTGISGVRVSNSGSTAGLVITGSELSVPSSGQRIVLYADLVTNASSGPIKFKSTAASFNATGGTVVSFTATEQFVVIEAASTTRWVISGRSTGVALAGTT